MPDSLLEKNVFLMVFSDLSKLYRISIKIARQKDDFGCQ